MSRYIIAFLAAFVLLCSVVVLDHLTTERLGAHITLAPNTHGGDN
jgi:hypothetical protein